MSSGLAIAGFVGAGLVLLGYFMVSRKVWQASSVQFQFCNLAGAGLLLIYSLVVQALPNILLNGVWVVIALVSLAGLYSRRKS